MACCLLPCSCGFRDNLAAACGSGVRGCLLIVDVVLGAVVPAFLRIDWGLFDLHTGHVIGVVGSFRRMPRATAAGSRCSSSSLDEAELIAGMYCSCNKREWWQ